MLSKSKLKNVSSIWIVPLVAVFIGLFLLYRHFSAIGETIYLYAENADSIVAGKTEIKYHSVTIGKVVKVTLSEDLSKVVLKAVMNREANRLLVEDSKLSLVKPRINSQGISGLDTLVSGVYIEMYPGRSTVRKNTYDLMDEIVTIGSKTRGIYINLNDLSDKSNSLVGEPITYHGYQVGVIVESNFSLKSRRMEHRGFVYSPYDALVTENSKFWYSSALDMSLGPTGLNIKVASIENFINGGVSFDVPKDSPLGKAAYSEEKFPLYGKMEDISIKKYDEFVEYAVLLDGNSKTLDPGSKVMHLGIQVGEVVDSNYDNENLFEPADKIMIPVILRIDRERVDPELKMTFEEFRTKVDNAVSNGLSASVESSGLIGSNMVINLNYGYGKNVGSRKTEKFRNYTVIPSVVTGFESIQKKLDTFLDNLNSLNLKATNEKIDVMVDELTRAISTLRGLASNLEKITSDSGRASVLNSINKTLIQIQKTMDSYSSNSEMYSELTSLLSSIRDTLKSVNPMVQKTNEQPNRYIFGDDSGDDRPRAGR